MYNVKNTQKFENDNVKYFYLVDDIRVIFNKNLYFKENYFILNFISNFYILLLSNLFKE